jgi:hypothetical protein
VSEAIELHVTIPPEIGQKAKSKAVAAGEEAISPTELGVWVPTHLGIGQNMGWHRGVQ